MIKNHIFIGICYHKDSPILRTEYLVPIQVGRAVAKKILPDMLGDDTGDNISYKNQNWSELTGLYWMWKNVIADYYGLMQYRRILNFSGTSDYRTRRFVPIRERECKKFGWDDVKISEACASHDIITSPLWGVHPVGAPHMLMSNYAMYAREHFAKDMDVVEALVNEKSPELSPFMTQMLIDRHAFFGNIVIMRSDIFDSYCHWLFGILEAAERQIDISTYDSYQRRIWGFLAERLAIVYVNYAKHVIGAKVCRKPLVMGSSAPVPISAAEVRTAIEVQAKSARSAPAPHGENEPINVLLAIDENYAPHAGVTIRSAIDTAHRPESLHFFVLEGGSLSKETKEKLSTIVKDGGGEIDFVKVDKQAFAWLPMNRDHISIETYFRLVMDKLLPVSIKKIIYIDADTIVADSLSHLWNVDLKDKPIGACADEGGVLQSRRLRLPLSHKYFNAGVAVFDLEKIRMMDFPSAVMKAYRENGEYITLQDQDILNIVFCDKCFLLPLRWNVNARVFLENELEPSYTPEEAIEAATAPGIIHFTDVRKPWKEKCRHPLRKIYWEYRNKTPWRDAPGDAVRRKLKAWLRQRVLSKLRG